MFIVGISNSKNLYFCVVLFLISDFSFITGAIRIFFKSIGFLKVSRNPIPLAC